MTCSLATYTANYVSWVIFSSTQLTYLSINGVVQTANSNGVSITTTNTNSILTVTSATQNLVYACILYDTTTSSTYLSGLYSVCPIIKSTILFKIIKILVLKIYFCKWNRWCFAKYLQVTECFTNYCIY